MIYGPKNWNKDFYCQDNNPTENLLKIITTNIRKKFKTGYIGYLETCGPTAAINCLGAMGHDLICSCPGFYNPQPEEILSDCMNDPKYKKDFQAVRKISEIPGNRIPQYYPLAVRLVFGVLAVFKWNPTWPDMMEKIKMGKTIQLCFKKPGHYFAVLAYDDIENEFIYNDPWVGHKKNKHGGHLERLTKKEFDTNTANYYIIYS